MRYFFTFFLAFLGMQVASLGAMEIAKLYKVPSLKWQCIKAISERQAEIPDLYDAILNELPQEISVLLVANIGDYDFALHYAAEHDINQEIADFIVENTQELIQKIINDPSLQSVFPQRMLAEENNNYLAWALYRRFLENQVRNNKYECNDRQAALMEGAYSPRCYYNQSIDAVLEEKLKEASAEKWRKAIRYFLTKADIQDRDHEIFDMDFSDGAGNQLATFKKYPASFEGEVFVDENNTMLLLGKKKGFKHLANAHLGLQIFRLDNLLFANNEELLGKIETAYFSDDLQKVLFETEAGNTFEFTVPASALDFIKNIHAESAASLLVFNSLRKLVFYFVNSELRSEQEYQPLHENFQKMLDSDAVAKSEYLQEKYKSRSECLDRYFALGPQIRPSKRIVPSLPEIIVGVAIGGIVTAVVFNWMMN